MTQSVKYLTFKHENLCLDLLHHVKSPGTVIPNPSIEEADTGESLDAQTSQPGVHSGEQESMSQIRWKAGTDI